MAALTVADELADIAGRLKRVEQELASLQEARVASAEHAKATQAAISAALNAAAERIEGLTRQLNQTARRRPRGDGLSPRPLANGEAAKIGGDRPPSALHCPGGAARCVRSNIPGALSISKGAVPGRARGPGHMAPTYFRREPGIDAPTAIAAPHFASVLAWPSLRRP